MLKLKEISLKPLKIGRGRKCKISKVLKRELLRTANKKPRVIALVSGAANSGVTVSKKTVAQALHRNGLHAHRPRKTPLLLCMVR